MHKDCIILCHKTDENGNLYCLKKINGKPFIDYVATYLRKFHICKVIFSISTEKDQFKEYILGNREHFSFAFDFAEQSPEDNNGKSVMRALQYSDTPDVLIISGHTYFDVNIDDLIAWQQTKMGDVTSALSYQENTNNYIKAHLNEENMIHEFSSGTDKSGLILGGTHCIFRPSFLNINFADNFSFEDDYLKKHLSERDLIGMISEGTFIDISQEHFVKKAEQDFPSIFKTNSLTDDNNR